MSGKPAARLGDPTQCPQTGHGARAIASGAPNVLFNGKPAARLGDSTTCGSALAGQVIPNVLINGRPAAVLGSTGSHGDAVIAGSGNIFIGTTTGSASTAVQAVGALVRTLQALFGAPLATRASIANAAPLQREEEEEEEETELPQKQRITLRVGMFFDGTLNNLPNASLTAQCRREDLAQLGPDGLDAVTRFCQSHGYNDSNGDAFFDQRPDNSYGNELSNVALLFRLYRDQSRITLPPDAKEASVPVYIEGSGSKAGEEDETMGMAFGQGETGVIERVRRSPNEIVRLIDILMEHNPQLLIESVEFDIFGFSRGAAAARHFANEVLADDEAQLSAQINSNLPGISDNFEWHQNTSINFIGLFDTVAAIGAPTQGHLSVGDDYNPGVNLYLDKACARKVLHLTAADEHRHNFSLNEVSDTHEQVALPGVHSNLGGGYPALSYERRVIGKPRLYRGNHYAMDGAAHQQLIRSYAWRAREWEESVFRDRGLPGDGRLIKHETPVERSPNSDILLTLSIERTVRGELSRIPLRLMHIKATAHDVPFETMSSEAPEFIIPADLQAISDKLISAVLNQQCPALTESEYRFLHARYIHCSANWVPVKGFLANKPRSKFRRAIYPDTDPQEAGK
tara:strand:- start:647 stop:2530 length:1884 start_codon:yes stop_codon:yes gene_type:complete